MPAATHSAAEETRTQPPKLRAAAGILLIAAAVIVGGLLYSWFAPIGPAPSLPRPYLTPSVYNWPLLVPKPEGRELQVPAGFHVDVYAEGFHLPRFMLPGPGGEVLVTDSMPRPAGAVYALIDKDRDFHPKQRKLLVKGLDMPTGLAFWKDYLYIGEAESVKRYHYDAATMTLGTGEEVVSLKHLRDFHWTRTILFDREGKKLYVAVGSGSNSALGEDPRRGAINRYNPDGSGHEIFAAGTRNPVGLHWYPGTDTLWISVQERDDLGDELVPDYLTHVQPGGFYGWPYAYIGSHIDPRNAGVRRMRHPLLWLETIFTVPALIRNTIVPDVLLGAHVAPLDILFYTGQKFPAAYRGGAFVAYHGSVNRATRTGYSIAFVPFQNGQPSGPPREFLTGWMMAPDKHEVWGRPVGLVQLPDGSLLVSDDGGKKLWRIDYPNDTR
ncbi:MAG TPA: PQQ-dependent sugar dehydrogenase [Bryobacteraceae bacterium]|nr:PQQ-dependent sugar dehydrogenase [Bryobacteraceae bacterium]